MSAVARCCTAPGGARRRRKKVIMHKALAPYSLDTRIPTCRHGKYAEFAEIQCSEFRRSVFLSLRQHHNLDIETSLMHVARLPIRERQRPRSITTVLETKPVHGLLASTRTYMSHKHGRHFITVHAPRCDACCPDNGLCISLFLLKDVRYRRVNPQSIGKPGTGGRPAARFTAAANNIRRRLAVLAIASLC